MKKAILVKAIKKLEDEFDFDTLTEAYIRQALKEVNLYDDLEYEESNYYGDTSTRTKTIEINFNDENIIEIDIRCYYKVEIEKQTDDVPESVEEILEDWEIVDIRKESILTENQIYEILHSELYEQN